MRRGKPELLVAILILLLLGSYVVYTQSVVSSLRVDARRSSQMFARVYRAFGDTAPGAVDQTLLDLSQSIRDQGVPLIWTDLHDKPAGHANLPFDAKDSVPNDDPRIGAYIAVLRGHN